MRKEDLGPLDNPEGRQRFIERYLEMSQAAGCDCVISVEEHAEGLSITHEDDCTFKRIARAMWN